MRSGRYRGGPLEVLGQALVQPQRQVGQGVVDQRVGAFVVEVTGPVVVPEGENVTAVRSLQVQSSAPGPVRDSLADVGPVSTTAGQQVDVDGLPGDRQIQRLVETGRKRIERIQDVTVSVQSEFRVDQERTVTLDGCPFRLDGPCPFREPCQEDGDNRNETDRLDHPPRTTT